jgi:hypothetical protein
VVDQRAVLAPIVVKVDNDEEVVAGRICYLLLGLGLRV